MEHHPYFDLWLHPTAELADRISEPIIERVTLTEWPLSFVQRLTLADGRRLIYKAQASEGIEPEFYANVRSGLLPEVQSLGRCENTTALLIEYIDAPRLADLSLSEAEILHHGRALAAAVQQMPENVPLYADLGSLERWQAFVSMTLAKLSRLVETGAFPTIRPETVARLADWAASAPVRAAYQGKITLAHADLSGGNAFLTPAGYKIIDWQFPRRLPDGFDLAIFLDFMGLDPYRFVDPAVVNLAWFIRVAWYVHCKADLFPDIDRYEGFVIQSAERLLAHTSRNLHL